MRKKGYYVDSFVCNTYRYKRTSMNQVTAEKNANYNKKLFQIDKKTKNKEKLDILRNK